METNYYKILGISKNSTSDQIKSAYRTLALKFHPDKNPSGKDQFQLLSKAYDVLGDPQNKELYDRRQQKLSEHLLPGNETIQKYFSRFSYTSEESKVSGFQDPPVNCQITIDHEDIVVGSIRRVFHRKVYNIAGGYITEDIKVTFLIEPDVKTGDRITLEKQGDKRWGRIPADLVFTMFVVKDSLPADQRVEQRKKRVQWRSLTSPNEKPEEPEKHKKVTKMGKVSKKSKSNPGSVPSHNKSHKTKKNEFQINTKVFAQLKGHIAWPAMILKELAVSGKALKYLVQFYGTCDSERVSAGSVYPYNSETLEKYGKADPRRAPKTFEEALREIAKGRPPGLESRSSRAKTAVTSTGQQ